MALVIAAVGLHGVVAYSVSQRRAELGVRMALGADAPRIRRMVVREGLILVAAGAGLGLLGAIAATRALSTLLYGVAASDPVSYILATAAAFAAGLAGSYLPARRASRTDAAVVLRGE
jgi:ABC-type antimicrobial peptide transport system permease subunit